MTLCEKYNVTVGIPVLILLDLMYTKDFKTLKGKMGNLLQRYLNSRKNFPYKCNLLAVTDVGEKQKNGSYDGALGFIERKEIDLFFRGEVPFIDNDNVYFSHPIYTEEFLIGQTISKKILSDFESKMQLVRSFNFDFLIYCLITVAIFFAVVIFFSLCSLFSNFSFKKFRLFHYFVKAIKKIRIEKNNNFSMIFLGFVLYNFLIQQIMTNNIKTTKVIVDTSELITNEEKLFESPLKATWINGESDLTFVRNAPNNTFLNKLYKLKNENPVKIFKRTFNEDEVPQLQKYFFFMKSYSLYIAINLLAPIRDDDIFINENPFYSTYNVLYLAKKMNPQKLKFIYKITQYSAQGGLIEKPFLEMKHLKVLEGKFSYKIYETLNSFVDDYTKFDSLRYENFHFFFLALFYFNFLVFSLFMIYCFLFIIIINLK